MSTWEERRRNSKCYKFCLIIILLPVLSTPIFLIISAPFLSLESVALGVLTSLLFVAMFLGCGIHYRTRSINPSSRNIMNVNDGHYFERIGPDESDYT